MISICLSKRSRPEILIEIIKDMEGGRVGFALVE